MVSLSQVSIESIAAGGDGVAHANGLAVFVPRTAPGDLAEVCIASRGRFGRGKVVRLVEAASTRVTPRCQHYDGDRCGGCQLQHIEYPSQLAAKQRIVRDALVRIARRDTPLPTIAPSPAPWEYRAKLTLALRRRDGQWTAGLRAYDDPNRIFQLHECPITEPGIVAAWREVFAAASHLPHERELRASIRRVGDEMTFLLEGGAQWRSAREFARHCPSLHLVRWKSRHGEAHVIADRRQRKAHLGAFEQVNPAVAALLQASVIAHATAERPRSVIDAYAGNGRLARPLAQRGIRVTAIEVDKDATAFAAAHGSPALRVVQARVEDVLHELLPADVVILNPPRGGVDPRVTSSLQEGVRPRVLLYVSCDPATLARDVGRLEAYRIASVEAYDMFPQTAHVEILCKLVPEAT